MSKVLERMLKERLSHWLETNRKLSPDQAGFRRLRTAEDQVLRITQIVADGFQHTKPAMRTLMVLIDFKRAFDKVWHVGLLHKMVDLGTPRCITKWCKAFLNDRSANVTINGTPGKHRHMKAGVPQGSVISPLLFLLFINDIADGLPDGVQASLFADDLAIWTQDSTRDMEPAVQRMKAALKHLSKWADKWKMVISTEKSECTLFSRDKAQAKFRPKLRLCGKKLKFNPNPVFLGVQFDRELTFNRHMAQVKKKMQQRCNVLRSLTGKEWGCQKEDMRQVYLAYIRSAAEHCSAAWYPPMAPSNKTKLEAAQNQCERVIAGTTLMSSETANNLETGLIPLQQRMQQLAAIAYERCRRLPDDNPVKEIACGQIYQRLPSVHSWREEGKDTASRHIPANSIAEPLAMCRVSPSEVPDNLDFDTSLASVINRQDPPELKKAAAMDALARFADYDLEIWTDGSARDATRDGGSGVFILDRRLGTRTKISVPAGAITSSFRAEATAINIALTWIRNNRNPAGRSILIATDSKSCVEKLASGPLSQRTGTECDIWEKTAAILKSPNSYITFFWVPGHSDLDGNEEADALARIGSAMPQAQVPIDFTTVKATIKKGVLDAWHSEARRHQGYGWDPRPPNRQLEEGLTRRERSILSQLRTGGYSPICMYYMHRIGRADSPACPDCGAVRDDAAHVVTQCPRTDSIRQRLIGHPRPELQILWSHPREVIEILRHGGRLGARRV